MEMILLRTAVHTNSWQCHVHRDSCHPIQSNKGDFFLTSSTLPLFRTNSDYKGRSHRLKVSCIGWDPEGILGPPQSGHIARREFQKKFGLDSQQREALERQSQQDLERRRAAREARVVPETVAGLVEYFLDTEAREIEYEIARCRVRLNEQFLSHLQVEMAALRFAVSRTKEMDDRLIELEALYKVLIEGIEAYDRMMTDLIGAKDRLAKILTSKDKKATLLEMLERNELDRSLLALLDENIVAAQNAGQVSEVNVPPRRKGYMDYKNQESYLPERLHFLIKNQEVYLPGTKTATFAKTRLDKYKRQSKETATFQNTYL